MITFYANNIISYEWKKKRLFFPQKLGQFSSPNSNVKYKFIRKILSCKANYERSVKAYEVRFNYKMEV